MRYGFLICLLLALGGCMTAGVSTLGGLLPVPAPEVDQPFVTTQYYNSKYGIDIAAAEHSLRKERDDAVAAAQLCTKITSGIKINGQSTPCKPRTKVFDKAKKIGNNDYVLGCTTVPIAEKQKGEGFCWAAGAQFMIAAHFRKHIEQERIVEKIKKGIPQDMKAQAGTVMDAMTALGFGGITLMPNGSEVILESLAANQPVMIGLGATDTEPGHAVIIVAARFSFPEAAIKSCIGCSKYAFTELQIYDPWTGETSKWPATALENRLDFIMTYDPRFT